MKFLFISTLLLSVLAQADYSGNIYELNSNKQKKVYSYTNIQEEKEGLTDQTMIYKDLEGNQLVTEKSQMKGAQFIKMELNHHQMNEKATVEIKDGKVYFTKTTADGKVKTADEKLGKTFVISSNFFRYVKENFSDLLNGKEVSFRFGSWERMETVGFEIFKVGEEKIGDQEVVVIKMKASSFIIAALVPPLFFKFTKDGTRLLEMKGRIPVKLKSGDSWKDQDAEVVYSY